MDRKKTVALQVLEYINQLWTPGTLAGQDVPVWDTDAFAQQTGIHPEVAAHHYHMLKQNGCFLAVEVFHDGVQSYPEALSWRGYDLLEELRATS